MISTNVVSHRKDPKYHTVCVDWVLSYGEQFPDQDMLLELAFEAALKATKKLKSGDEVPFLVRIMPETASVEFTGKGETLIMSLKVEGYTPISAELRGEEAEAEAEEPLDIDTHEVVLRDDRMDAWGFVGAVRAATSGFPLLLPANVESSFDKVFDADADFEYLASGKMAALGINQALVSVATH